MQLVLATVAPFSLSPHTKFFTSIVYHFVSALSFLVLRRACADETSEQKYIYERSFARLHASWVCMLLLRFRQAYLARDDRRMEFDKENCFVDAAGDREIMGSYLQNVSSIRVNCIQKREGDGRNGGYCGGEVCSRQCALDDARNISGAIQ